MKTKENFKISGTVSSDHDGQGVSKLRVEAWDKDVVIDDLLGSRVTDKNGRFTIKFDNAHYQEICIDRKPDIYFKVYQDDKLILTTEQDILWNVSEGEKEVNIEVSLTKETTPVKTKGAEYLEMVDRVKHRIHLFQGGIAKLKVEAEDLRERGDEKSASRIESKIKIISSELSQLEKEATKIPEVANALGLVQTVEPAPVEVKEIVEAASFKTFGITVKEPEKFAYSKLNTDWPRTGQVIKGDELITLEMVGKLRMQVNSTMGEPAPNVPFQVTTTDEKTEKELTLKRGLTNINGYASVNLNNLAVDKIKDIAITVGEGKDDERTQKIPIDKVDLVTHRDFGIAHQLKLRPGVFDYLKPLFPPKGSNGSPGTIEEPDDADINNSPSSFGLNEAEVDGNCCLRPRAEFAAREYHFRQIIRLEDPKLVSGSKPIKRRQVRAPIPFEGESLSTYSVTGGDLLLGTVNLYRQGWYPVGRGLGEVLYSLALAPCEHVNLAFIDWSRQERDTRAESRVAQEQLEHELNHNRSIEEVVDSVLNEHQSGSSASGGGGLSLDLGFFSIGGGGGGTDSSTSGRRSLQASTVQSISDGISQRSSAIRSQRSTVVTTSSQRESERIQTRTVHNHNKNHAMTVQYFQVLSYYSVKTELVEEKPVVLVPYEIDEDIFDNIPSFNKFLLAPARPITRFLDRHSRLIRRMVSRRYRRAFESLSRLLHCRDVYDIEQPYATFSRWNIRLDKAWRKGISLSIETNSGQSLPLTPRGGREGHAPVEFVSDPVKTGDIDAIRVSFDAVEAARSVGSSGLFSMLGDSFADLLEKTVNHKITRIEISARTDRSRFVPEPQTYRLTVDQPDETLSADNPFLLADISPPPVNFDGYRGREHQDYCKLKQLIAYIHSIPMRFMRAVWYYEDPDRRALRLDKYQFQGASLLDNIVNKPVGILGNYVAFKLLEGHRLVQIEQPNYTVSSRVVSLPTRGVFAEVFLSCCNATEKRDVERFIDPGQACQTRAPEITGVSPGTRASRGSTTPTNFPAPIVNLQNAPGVPDPGGLTAALNVLGKPDIFRDLSHGAELLQFINNATKEAFTSTRQHRAAMNAIAGDIIRGLVSANTGLPTGSGSTSQAAGSGTTGITSSPSGSGGDGPNTIAPGASGTNPALQTLSSELVRQASPAQVSDHVQTVRRAVDSGLLTGNQGNQLTNSLLGGTADLADATTRPIIILNEPTSRDGLAFGPMTSDKSATLTLTATVRDAPDDATVRWTSPNPAAFTLGSADEESTAVTPQIPGLHEIGFVVRDSSGTALASIRVPLSVPQFVAIREEPAALDGVLTDFQLINAKEEVLQVSKTVCDLLLSSANVRTVWEMVPFGESLPSQFATGGSAAHRVTVATLRGNPPANALAGRTSAAARGIGATVYNEPISVWPGAYDDNVTSSAARDVDDATREVVRAMQGLDFTDIRLKSLAVEIVGRLMGETLAHEIIHSLLGHLIPTGHNSPAIAQDIMNNGRDRSLQSRTSIEISDMGNFPDEGTFVDHGIGFINIPTASTQALIDGHFPISV